MEKIFGTKFCALFLAVLMFAMPAMAYGDYTTTTVQENSYNASSPAGYFATYPPGSTVTTTPYYNGYYGYGYVPVNNTIINTAPQGNNQPANGNFVNGINTNQQVQNGQQVQPAQAVNYSQPIPAGTTVASLPASVQDIRTPQNFTNKTVTTQTTHDGTETVDKVINRSGKVIGILALAGLAAAATTFIFTRK